MNFDQILLILRARKLLVISTFFGVVAFIVGVSLILPKKYTATASIVIDSKSPDPINGMIMQGAMLPGYISTQLDVLRSDRVTLKVIRALKLDQSGVMKDQWREDTEGLGDFNAWLAEILLKKLDVVPSKESSVITVGYSAADPGFAAALTNAFVQAYIETTLELRVEPAKRFSALFDEQSKHTRDKLEQAQTKLSAYQQAKGMIATDERLDIESARLAELSNQLVAIQALSAESRSRKAQAGANTVEVLTNPVVSALKADLSSKEARLKELTASLGNAHPQVLQLQANIQELRSKVDAEVGRIASSMSINNTVNLSREAQVKVALEAQREKLLQLKAQRDEASVLLSDVANAQRNYDALQARFAQTSLESQSNQTNVSVLKVATPPADPSSPRIVLNTVAAIILGGMLSVGLALFREAKDRRIRQEEDVRTYSGSVILGTMPIALEAKRGALLPVRNAPRLSKRSLPELSAPKKT
jgi:succinoglycan biosynthesis transport protein ExoP